MNQKKDQQKKRRRHNGNTMIEYLVLASVIITALLSPVFTNEDGAQENVVTKLMEAIRDDHLNYQESMTLP